MQGKPPLTTTDLNTAQNKSKNCKLMDLVIRIELTQAILNPTILKFTEKFDLLFSQVFIFGKMFPISRGMDGHYYELMVTMDGHHNEWMVTLMVEKMDGHHYEWMVTLMVHEKMDGHHYEWMVTLMIHEKIDGYHYEWMVTTMVYEKMDGRISQNILSNNQI